MGSNGKLVNGIVAGVLGLIFIFYVVSNALPSWIKVSDSQTQGLWKSCVLGGGEQVCADFTCSTDQFGAACSKILTSRAFMTLSCITSVLAAICFIISVLLGDGIRSIILMIGKVLIPVCFLMGVIGVATGIVGILGDGGKLGDGIELGPGSIIGIIAVILNVFAIVGSIITK